VMTGAAALGVLFLVASTQCASGDTDSLLGVFG